MAKFYATIGFVTTVEQTPGVWMESQTTKRYACDVISVSRRLQNDAKANDDINIANRFSIVGDPYAMSNFFAMRWIEFQGVRWQITSVEVERPRLVLTIGGLYNESQTSSA